MSSDFAQLDRFLTRVHRRWTITRALERIGICVFAACAIAIVLSGILIYRGESALQLSWICLAIGLIVGAVIGFLSRPTMFDAATEVDRQLNLSDLLATALSVRKPASIRSRR